MSCRVLRRCGPRRGGGLGRGSLFHPVTVAPVVSIRTSNATPSSAREGFVASRPPRSKEAPRCAVRRPAVVLAPPFSILALILPPAQALVVVQDRARARHRAG